MTMLQQILQRYFERTKDHTFDLLCVGHHNPARDHTKFRASDAAKCHRMRYFKRQGLAAKPDFSLEVQLALQTGNLLHAFLQQVLGDEGVLAAAEMTLEDTQRIGHLDALIKNYDQLILYDFKTVGGKQMYYLKQENQPKPEHVAQVMTYWQMYAATDAGEHQPVDYCQIAYLSRDTLEIVEHTVGTPGIFPAENFDAIDEDWHTLINYWDRQETPPMTRNNWECKYCQYQAHCAPGGAA